MIRTAPTSGYADPSTRSSSWIRKTRTMKGCRHLSCRNSTRLAPPPKETRDKGNGKDKRKKRSKSPKGGGGGGGDKGKGKSKKPPEQIPCYYHNTYGECKKEGCKFAHRKATEAEAKQYFRPRSATPGKPPTKSKEVCIRHFHGTCTKSAEECKYSHVIPPGYKPPEKGAGRGGSPRPKSKARAKGKAKAAPAAAGAEDSGNGEAVTAWIDAIKAAAP